MKSHLRAFRRLTTTSLLVVICLTFSQCSVNPVSGKRELSLVSEAQEIAMGKEADPQIVAQFGLYPDQGLQDYIQRLGETLAKSSERPELPWTFRVLDDPLVNAFALPGGYIYVTRGIMAHLGSEAELVGVLGHEIGHVTARHGASQQSKAILAQIGFGVSAVLAPRETQAFGGLAQGLAGLLFLKYGRDDERQADGLGVRYAMFNDYDPRELEGVFETLGRVSQASGTGGVPGWASTHPAPENRTALIAQQIGELNRPLDGLTINRDSYMQRLDGVVFGTDVRQGFFVDQRFYHPDLAFVLDFPSGWQTANARQRVAAINKEGSAMVDLTLANGATPQAAGDVFYQQQGVNPKGSWERVTKGLDGLSRPFGVADQQGAEVIQGYSSFLQDGDRIYQLLGYGKANERSVDWNSMRASLASMRRLTDRKILDVQPMRIDLQKLTRRTTVDQLAELSPDVSVETLMLINRLDPDSVLPAGSVVKVVRGFNPQNGLPR